MSQAIEAYRLVSERSRARKARFCEAKLLNVATTPEFKELERMRSKARHDEAQALYDVKMHWQGIVADKDAALADKDARIAELEARLELAKR